MKEKREHVHIILRWRKKYQDIDVAIIHEFHTAINVVTFNNQAKIKDHIFSSLQSLFINYSPNSC